MSFLLRSSAVRSSAARTASQRAGGLRPFSATSPTRNLAKLTVVGRLGADAEVLTAPSGKEMVRYVVATNHGSVENRYTSWWRVTAFPSEEMRDGMVGRFKKGAMVYVEGVASMRKFENSEGKIDNALNIVQSVGRVLSPPPERASEEGVAEAASV